MTTMIPVSSAVPRSEQLLQLVLFPPLAGVKALPLTLCVQLAQPVPQVVEPEERLPVLTVQAALEAGQLRLPL